MHPHIPLKKVLISTPFLMLDSTEGKDWILVVNKEEKSVIAFARRNLRRISKHDTKNTPFSVALSLVRSSWIPLRELNTIKKKPLYF